MRTQKMIQTLVQFAKIRLTDGAVFTGGGSMSVTTALFHHFVHRKLRTVDSRSTLGNPLRETIGGTKTPSKKL